jgi:hypothetical protein
MTFEVRELRTALGRRRPRTSRRGHSDVSAVRREERGDEREGVAFRAEQNRMDRELT